MTKILDIPSRATTFTVAASNSQPLFSRQADLVCDGIDDDAQINYLISEAANTGGEIVLSEGSYNLTSTITMAQNVNLRLLGNATLIPQGDFNVVTMTKNSSIGGGKIDTSGVTGFSKAAIYLDGSQLFHVTDNLCRVEGLSLKGGDMGYAIHLFADGSNEWIAGVKISGLLINDFGDGIRIETQQPTSGFNFINGNHFHDIWINDCDYGIRILAENKVSVQGNIFIATSIEADSNSVNALYCEGRGNIFSALWIWDWTQVESSSPYAIEMASVSSMNRISGTFSSRHVKDYSQNIGGYYYNIIETNLTGSTLLNPINSPPTGQGLPTGYGPHSDYLVNADDRFTVTVTAGDAPTSGTLAEMFDDDPTTGPYWAWGETFPLELEVDFGRNIYHINAVGAFFDTASRPGGIKFEFYDASESSWLSIYDDGITDGSNDRKTYWIQTYDHELGIVARNGVSKIRITIDDIASGKNGVRINCWWLFAGDSFGERWLARGGGEVYGNIDFAGTMGNSSKNPTTDAPADWVQVKIGGTTYYLPAYTAS